MRLLHSGRMKTSENQLSGTRRQHAEIFVEKHIGALFERLPMLCGFHLRHDLELADLSVCTWPGADGGEELVEALIQALADIAEERPEAVQLLRNRTFARAFH